MRLRLLKVPRGPLAQQVAAHVLVLCAVALLWTWGGARSLKRVHDAGDARLAASRLRQRLLEAQLSAEMFLARDVQDPRFFLGVPLPAIEEHTHAVSDATDRLAAVERLRPELRASTEALRALIEKYQGAFRQVTELRRRQGYAEWGLEGDWQKALREADGLAGGRAELTLGLLELRRREKDYLLRRDAAQLERVSEQVAALKDAARGLGPAPSGRLRNALDQYHRAVAEYGALERRLGVGADAGLRAEMSGAVRDMEPLLRVVNEDAVRRAGAARRGFWTTSALLLAAGLLLGGASSFAVVRFFSKATAAPSPAPAATPVTAAGPRHAEPLLEAVVAGLGDAVYVKDLTGRYLVANDACAALMGRERAEIVGRDNRELLSPEAAQLVEANDRAILESGTTLTYEMSHGERTLAATKGVVRDAEGHVVGLFGVSRDVTDRKRTEAALRAQDERLSRMGDAIRSLALEGSPDALVAMADRLRELGRLEAGAVTLGVEPLAVREVVAAAAHAVTCHVDSKVPETLLGDAARLRQVLACLIGTAVRRSDRSAVRVNVDAFDLGHEMTLFRVVVADNGAAVAPELRPRLFEPFAHEAGLELAIAARHAALMGGRIDVEDAPGGGSVFTFTARLRAAPVASQAAAPAPHVS